MSTSPTDPSGNPLFNLGFPVRRSLPANSPQVLAAAEAAAEALRNQVMQRLAVGIVDAAQGTAALQQSIETPFRPALNGKARAVDNLQRRIVDSVNTGVVSQYAQTAYLGTSAPGQPPGPGSPAAIAAATFGGVPSTAGSVPQGGGGTVPVWYVLDPGNLPPGTYPQAVCEPVESTSDFPIPSGAVGPFSTPQDALAYIDANYQSICGVPPPPPPTGGGQYVVCCAAPPVDSGTPSIYQANDPNIPGWCVGNYAFAGTEQQCNEWVASHPTCMGVPPPTPPVPPVQPPPPLPPPPLPLPQPPPIPAPGQPGGPPGGNGQCPAPTVTCPAPTVVVNVPPCPPCPPTGQPPPPPPPPPPTGKPPAPAVQPTAGGIGPKGLLCPSNIPRLPLPGTDKWCAEIDSFIAGLASIGQGVIDLGLAVAGGLGQISGALGQIPIVGPFIAGLASDLLYPIQETVALVGSCAQIARCIVPCPPDVYLQLVACRALFSVLDRIRGGVDPGVWLTTDVQISMSHVTHLIDYLISYTCPTEIPGIGETIDCYLRGQITLEMCQCWIWMRGGVWETWAKVIAARRRQPEQIEILRLENRGNLQPGEMDGRLRNLGFVDERERRLIEELRNELPGPSDLVRFAVRHVFEPSLVQRFDFAAEMPQAFLDWHAKLGLGYPITIKDSITGQEQQLTWAQAHWEAHWVWPSPTQAYEMLFRFYPGRDTSKEPDISKNLTFKVDDLNYLLRGNDYPPHWRPYLAGIAYRLPGIRYMQDLYRFKVWGRPQLVQNLRQTGYSPQMAEDLADLMIARIPQPKPPKPNPKLVAAIVNGYKIGTLDFVVAARRLQDSGMDVSDVTQALAIARLQVAEAKAEREIKRVRNRYWRGEYNEHDVRNALQQLTISQDAIDDYVDEWKFEKEDRHAAIALNRLETDAVDGLVSDTEFARRARNLGYTEHDIGIMQAEITMKRNQRLLVAIGKVDAAVQKSVRQAAAAARAAKVQHDQAVRALLSHGSPADLAKWYVDNLIDRSQVINRLRQAGWPDADVDRLLDEALIKAKQATKPTVQIGQPPPIPPEQGSPSSPPQSGMPAGGKQSGVPGVSGQTGGGSAGMQG